MKQAEDILEKIKAMPFEQGLREALELRSDDFGHDCTMLLQAESELLQHFGEKFLSQLDLAHAAGRREADEACKVHAELDADYHYKRGRREVIAEIESCIDGISPTRLLSCIEGGSIENVATSVQRYIARALKEKFK